MWLQTHCPAPVRICKELCCLVLCPLFLLFLLPVCSFLKLLSRGPGLLVAQEVEVWEGMGGIEILAKALGGGWC